MKQTSQTLDSFELSESAQSIQWRLTKVISDKIKQAGGQISFAKYMNMALYQQNLGYYKNELQTFGEKGDFITAPEMGQYFALCIANSIGPMFENSCTSQESVILEIGAGSGVLAVNLLQALAQSNALPSQYLILEPSASLQQQQKERINQCSEAIKNRVVWISELPEKVNGVILANEVVDAMPVERIQKIDEQWFELGVTENNGQFENVAMNPADMERIPKILSEPEEQSVFVEGYTTEFRSVIKGWIKSLAASLNSGVILLFDYGYAAAEFYHPQRVAGTLNCFIRHHQHADPFQFVGLQDITAHVDFSQIAVEANKNQLTVSGFTTQAGFLLENGITEFAEQQVTDQPPEVRYQRSQEMQKLLMPGQMGEVVKVILLTKSLKTEIKGFSMQDHLHRL